MNRTFNIPVVSTLQNWLVYHPKILHFSWNRGHTIGSSPRFVATTLLCYLFFTYFLSSVLSRHPPLPRRLHKSLSAVYNIAIITVSLAMALGCILSVLTYAPNFKHIACFPKSTTPTGPIFFWGYIFYLSKIMEFTDTLLIILSYSSKRRLTFLHVYHHSMTLILCHLALNTVQSSYPTIVASNSTVHVLMYTYYLLTTVGFRPRWKKVVTEFQLLQFWSGFWVLALILYYHLQSGCSGMWSWSFNIVYVISLIVLFTDFHKKSYSSPKIKSV